MPQENPQEAPKTVITPGRAEEMSSAEITDKVTKQLDLREAQIPEAREYAGMPRVDPAVGLHASTLTAMNNLRFMSSEMKQWATGHNQQEVAAAMATVRQTLYRSWVAYYALLAELGAKEDA